MARPPPSPPHTSKHTHSISYTRAAAGGGGIGGRGEFRRVVGIDGWGVGENGRDTEAVGVDVDSLLQRVFPLTQKTEKHPQAKVLGSIMSLSEIFTERISCRNENVGFL